MCPQEFNAIRPVTYPPNRVGFYSLRIMVGFLLIFVFSLAFGYTHAQNLSEEYASVQKWVLPSSAKLFTELVQKEETYFYESNPYSGWAYERYPNGQVLRAMSLREGKQDGLLILWYPDGKPQMSATYKYGYLHGRFLGWYNSGGVIYDMNINKGTYAGDSLIDNDDSRGTSETTDTEGEGPDNDNSPE